MIHATRMHTTVESEHLRIPELGQLPGKRVEIILVEDEPQACPANEVDTFVTVDGLPPVYAAAGLTLFSART